MFRWALLILLFSNYSQSALIIPTNMNKSDREKLVSILAPGTMMKLLSDPFPMGGYSGVEVGVSGHLIDTKDIAALGDKTTAQSELTYMSLFIGKGLFYNLDIGIDFAPLEQPDGITYFSGQLRWGIHQGRRLPLYWSLIFTAGGGTFQSVGLNSQEVSLIGGYRSGSAVLYIGAGQFLGQGFFVDGNKESVSVSHYLTGLSIDMGSGFVSLELDQFSQASYSVKLGTRF